MFGFSQDTTEESAAPSKNIIQSIFGGTIFNAENKAIREGGESGELGIHSVKNISVAHVRQSGDSKNEQNIRGRWKGKARV